MREGSCSGLRDKVYIHVWGKRFLFRIKGKDFYLGSWGKVFIQDYQEGVIQGHREKVFYTLVMEKGFYSGARGNVFIHWLWEKVLIQRHRERIYCLGKSSILTMRL